MSLVISIVMIGLCAASFGFAWARRRERKKIQREDGLALHHDGAGLAVKYILPMSRSLKNRFRPLATRRGILKIGRRLAAAGMDETVDAETVAAARVLLAVFFAAFCFFVFPFSAPLNLAVGFLAGWSAPVLWLVTAAKKRREAIELLLPGALDWLALSVEAGMDFAQAMQRVAMRAQPPLRAEFVRLNFEIRMGIPRREALLNLSRRATAPALSRMAVLIAQADALGVSIGPVLKAGASRLRFLRFARAEKKGMLAQQMMLLPLVFLIMPATFVVIFGPILVRVILGGIDALF